MAAANGCGTGTSASISPMPTGSSWPRSRTATSVRFAIAGGSGPARHKFKVKRNLRYGSGTAKPKLHFFHSGALHGKGDHQKYYSGGMAPNQTGESAPGDVTLELKVLRFQGWKDDNDADDESITSIHDETFVNSEKTSDMAKSWTVD